jgi:hypothetical protein
MNGFDFYDRFDFVISWLMAFAVTGAMVLGAPLWAIALTCATCCTTILLHHFDEFFGR